MFKNYLKIALRTLERRKGYTFINVFGLATGVACCLLIFLYVRNEVSVNAHIEDVERIYRVDSDWREASMGLPITTLAPVAQTLVQEYPEVEDGVRLYLMTDRIRVGDKAFRRDVMMADPQVLELFSLPMLAGDPATALLEPYSVVITDALAQTLFGTTDVLGETILFETWQRGEQPYTVTGVRRALPFNSITHFNADHERYDLIIPAQPYGDFFEEAGWTSWQSRYILQYVKLAPDADVNALQAKLGTFVETYAPETFHGNLNITLNPLRTLYLTDNENLGWRIVGVLSTVALLILLIACINFMNLSTARSLARAREVGVRKTVGAVRWQLVAQFLSESSLIALMATIIGAALASLFIDALFDLADKPLLLTQPWDLTTFAALLGVALVTGVLAGLYPAFVLSSFRPVKALKGTLRVSPSTRRLRQGLVVGQFALAIVLLVTVYTISQQMDFITSRDLGFERENILVINSVPRAFDESGLSQMEAVKTRLTDLPSVTSASLSWRTAAEGTGTRALHPPDWSREQALSVQSAVVDNDFAQTYSIPLTAGRFFSDERPADATGIVLNESAVQAFGWEDGIEGKSLVVWQTARPDPAADLPSAQPVIGVVEDFHFESLHTPIRPLAFFSVEADSMYRVLALRLAGGNLHEAVAEVEAVWQEVLPHAPFEFTFLDDQIDQNYQTEQQLRQVVGLAALLAILIACLGMLGLAALNTQQRTKEIGVRKVLGASGTHILLLLSRDFTRPVLLAILLAAPVAYLLMQYWLSDFAYKIELGGSVFAVAGLTALVVAWLTVSYHAIRAALADPVQSLRYE
ncbi:MAG TPA: ABC transporter permease [Rhodothermales bacterium]|nr:ABC transporter permease [Rhodothermales bacterium]